MWSLRDRIPCPVRTGSFEPGTIPASLLFPTSSLLEAPNANTATMQGVLLMDQLSIDSANWGLYYFPTAVDLRRQRHLVLQRARNQPAARRLFAAAGDRRNHYAECRRSLFGRGTRADLARDRSGGKHRSRDERRPRFIATERPRALWDYRFRSRFHPAAERSYADSVHAGEDLPGRHARLSGSDRHSGRCHRRSGYQPPVGMVLERFRPFEYQPGSHIG